MSTLPTKLCSTCHHWSKYPEKHKDGYLVANCQQPKDVRDWKLKRGGENCSKWQKIIPPKPYDPYDPDPFYGAVY